MCAKRGGLIAIALTFSPFLILGSIFAEIAQNTAPCFQKGMCYVSWEQARYESEDSDKSLKELARTGTEWVQIVTTYYQNKYNSKEIFPTGKTPSDASLIHAIKDAKSFGMKVMLKPHIDLLDDSDGLDRTDIGFQSQEDWQEWFSQYANFILHYANLAQENNVELFCIGAELSFASQQAAFWQKEIIPHVREVYSGKITYAANWDEYNKVGFWADLDYAGIDSYFPLVTSTKKPRIEELRNAWQKWVKDIEKWQKSINKPVIFTETGYKSSGSAAGKPWEYTYVCSLDPILQANLYKALLETFWDKPWFYGVYWWYWSTSPNGGGEANCDFTPQNKPAEAVVKEWYSRPISQKQY